MSFTDKVIVVTGAASGIGRAVATRFAVEGASVALLDVNKAGLDEAAADPLLAGARHCLAECDVSDEVSVQGALQTVTDALGPVDVLCNIAGIGRFIHTHDTTLDEWNRILAVNATGTFLMAREVLPVMLERGGVIINTASNAGLQGVPYGAAYCASKGAVVQLTRALAQEYSDRGVRVNAVAPGGVETPIHTSFGIPEDGDPRKLAKLISPVGMSQPHDMAGAYAFLASDDAAYMHGTVVSIDGGLTA